LPADSQVQWRRDGRATGHRGRRRAARGRPVEGDDSAGDGVGAARWGVAAGSGRVGREEGIALINSAADELLNKQMPDPFAGGMSTALEMIQNSCAGHEGEHLDRGGGGAEGVAGPTHAGSVLRALRKLRGCFPPARPGRYLHYRGTPPETPGRGGIPPPKADRLSALPQGSSENARR